jgi:hypothetical protein
MTAKHQATGAYLKPMVRIFKNIRNRMTTERMIAADSAPSYFIEGMLYNVPNHLFGGNYQQTLVRLMNWLLGIDRAELLCANELYYLLDRGDPAISWAPANCTAFLAAAANLWDQW